MVRVKVDYGRLVVRLVEEGHLYITSSRLSEILGISSRAAGKLLSDLSRNGYAVKWSRRTYKLTPTLLSKVNADNVTAKEAHTSYSRSPPPAQAVD